MKTNPGITYNTFARIKSRIWNLPCALVLIWVLVLVWGERVVFDRSVKQCLWQEWESWVSANRTQALPIH